MVFSSVVSCYSSVQLFFAIAGKCFCLLESGHRTKAEINHFAKLCKEKNTECKYGDLFFQT